MTRNNRQEFNTEIATGEARNVRSMFQPAVRVALPIRLAISGPSGSGKTIGALRLAYSLAEGDWSKVFVINTEPLANGVGYVDTTVPLGDRQFTVGQYMLCTLDPPHHPRYLIEAIQAAVNEGAKVVILDTFCVWAGRGGVREIHDNMEGNSWTNWTKVNPLWNSVMDYMTYECPIHVIATIRSQMKRVMETEEGPNGQTRNVIRLVGMAPLIRPDSEYEFPMFVQLNRDSHRADIVTMRGGMVRDIDPLTNTLELTEAVGTQLLAWAHEGESWEPPGIPVDINQLGTPVQVIIPGGSSRKGPMMGGIPSSDFWEIVYRWAGKKKLTQQEAREEANAILEPGGANAAHVLHSLSLQWNDGGLEDLPPDIAQMVIQSA